MSSSGNRIADVLVLNLMTITMVTRVMTREGGVDGDDGGGDCGDGEGYCEDNGSEVE